MPDLKFNGEVIPVAHLLPDDVLVFMVREPVPVDGLVELRRALRRLFPEPRKLALVEPGMDLEIHRDDKPIPVGETCEPD